MAKSALAPTEIATGPMIELFVAVNYAVQECAVIVDLKSTCGTAGIMPRRFATPQSPSW